MKDRWKTILAVDFNRNAVLAYRANFPGVICRHKSVADIIQTLPYCDVLLGGPPCQSFSQAGKGKGKTDARDCLPDFCSAVERIKPRMFLMENVPGLINQKHRDYAKITHTRLMRAGYAVKVKVLNSVNYGSPQQRKRCWWWGIRNDLHENGIRHQWPKATHVWPWIESKGFGLSNGELLPAVTVNQALKLNPKTVGIMRGHGHYKTRNFSIDKPFIAITGSPTDVIFEEDKKLLRKITVAECSRLQSMPDGYVWPEKMVKTNRHILIGNGWNCAMSAAMSQSFAAVDPESSTCISLFCGGGLGDLGWHQRYWKYEQSNKKR